MKKFIGYVVVADGWLMSLSKDFCPKEPRGDQRTFRFGTLWLNGAGTLFSSRRSAERAIDRAIKYADWNGYDWPHLKSATIAAVKA